MPNPADSTDAPRSTGPTRPPAPSQPTSARKRKRRDPTPPPTTPADAQALAQTARHALGTLESTITGFTNEISDLKHQIAKRNADVAERNAVIAQLLHHIVQLNARLREAGQRTSTSNMPAEPDAPSADQVSYAPFSGIFPSLGDFRVSQMDVDVVGSTSSTVQHPDVPNSESHIAISGTVPACRNIFSLSHPMFYESLYPTNHTTYLVSKALYHSIPEDNLTHALVPHWVPPPGYPETTLDVKVGDCVFVESAESFKMAVTDEGYEDALIKCRVRGMRQDGRWVLICVNALESRRSAESQPSAHSPQNRAILDKLTEREFVLNRIDHWLNIDAVVGRLSVVEFDDTASNPPFYDPQTSYLCRYQWRSTVISADSVEDDQDEHEDLEKITSVAPGRLCCARPWCPSTDQQVLCPGCDTWFHLPSSFSSPSPSPAQPPTSSTSAPAHVTHQQPQTGCITVLAPSSPRLTHCTALALERDALLPRILSLPIRRGAIPNPGSFPVRTTGWERVTSLLRSRMGEWGGVGVQELPVRWWECEVRDSARGRGEGGGEGDGGGEGEGNTEPFWAGWPADRAEEYAEQTLQFLMEEADGGTHWQFNCRCGRVF